MLLLQVTFVDCCTFQYPGPSRGQWVDHFVCILWTQLITEWLGHQLASNLARVLLMSAMMDHASTWSMILVAERSFLLSGGQRDCLLMGSNSNRWK